MLAFVRENLIVGLLGLDRAVHIVTSTARGWGGEAGASDVRVRHGESRGLRCGSATQVVIELMSFKAGDDEEKGLSLWVGWRGGRIKGDHMHGVAST